MPKVGADFIFLFSSKKTTESARQTHTGANPWKMLPAQRWPEDTPARGLPAALPPVHKSRQPARNGLCRENATAASTIAALRGPALMQEITMCKKTVPWGTSKDD